MTILRNSHSIKKFLAHFCFFAATAFALIQCGNRNVAGGGSEGGNVDVVAGVIYNTDGSEAITARVVLIPSDYDPVKDSPTTQLHIDTTDDHGRYKFTNVQAGSYNCQASSSDSGTLSFIAGLNVRNDTVAIPGDTLKKPGGVNVILSDSMNGYVYIPGTTFYASTVDTSGRVLFSSLPPVTVDSFIFVDPQNNRTITIEKNVKVISDTTVEAGLFSTVILMNSPSEFTMPEPLILKKLLEKTGSRVTMLDVGTNSPEKLDSANLIYIYFTTSLNTIVASKLHDISKPVICTNKNYFYPLGMIGDTLNAGEASKSPHVMMFVKILNSSHPLSAGFSDSVQIMINDSATFTYAAPSASATSVMGLYQDTTFITLFAFDKNALLADGAPAPAKRTGAFFNARCFELINDNGKKIFKSMIEWAMSGNL